jgi:ABC-2 type transport system ATP-binding protein
MTAVRTMNLTKQYGARTAVNALDLTIQAGETLALLGENGAGKTTTIKMLSCLVAPTAGDALMMGESIVDNPTAVKRRINLSPQETAVATHLTARENLEMIAGIYGSSRAEAQADAEIMLDRLGLRERADERAKALSGGLQRRLSIAMALITKPQVLFLDEPTVGLDVRARNALWQTLLKLKGKVTILLTTHYLGEAEALADRIAVMHDGVLLALGTPASLKEVTGALSLEEAYLLLTEPAAIQEG